MDSSYQKQREAIIESIEKNRHELQHAVDDLRETMLDKVNTVRRQIDIRQRIREQPWIWLLGGFSLGLCIGFRKRRF